MKKIDANNKGYLLIGGIVLTVLAVVFSLVYDLLISSALSFFGGSAVASFMVLVGKINSVMLTLLGLALVFFINKKEFRKFVVGIFTTIVSVVLLKMLIERPRPYLAGIEVPLNIIKDSYTTWNWSFPSSHSAIPFFVIPFIPKKWRLYWIIFAVIMAFSRIYLGLHYLSDVIFGASLGLIIAYAFKKIKA